ncbi:MAG: adenylate kinase family protein [Thermoplasmata archaeon]
MRVALSGTPGTGKSSVARELRGLGERVVDLNELARQRGLLGRSDRRRRTREVDLHRLNKVVRREFSGGRVFLEGHLSHLLDVDRAVVLRCSPRVLRRRLRARGYPEAKVRENSLAEALDTITIEAVGRLGKRSVVELDATRRSPRSLALEIAKIARRGFRGGRPPGSVDFSDDVLRNHNYYIRNNPARD